MSVYESIKNIEGFLNIHFLKKINKPDFDYQVAFSFFKVYIQDMIKGTEVICDETINPHVVKDNKCLLIKICWKEMPGHSEYKYCVLILGEKENVQKVQTEINWDL